MRTIKLSALAVAAVAAAAIMSTPKAAEAQTNVAMERFGVFIGEGGFGFIFDDYDDHYRGRRYYDDDHYDRPHRRWRRHDRRWRRAERHHRRAERRFRRRFRVER